MKSPDSLTIELRMMAMEGEFRLEKEDILPDQGTIACPPAISLGQTRKKKQKGSTSDAVPCRSSHHAIEPADMALCLPDDNRMTFLEEFVDGDQGLEGLDFIGEDGLPAGKSTDGVGLEGIEGIHFHAGPKGVGGFMVPCVDDAAPNMLA
jgi:hypothetical protein